MSPIVEVLYTTGDYGATVAVVDRGGRGSYALRYTASGAYRLKALGHRDLRRAQKQAREFSRALANTRASESGAPGAKTAMTVAELFARYTREVSVHKKGAQPKEDERRRTLWLAVLGPDRPARQVTKTDVRQFIVQRSAGTLVVPELELAKKPKPRTVDADVVWLLAVYNWATRDAELLPHNPLIGAKRPQVTEQLRPMADPARVEKLLKVASKVHPRFALLLTCVRLLGWRISAICAIDGADIDRTPTAFAPYGLIRKNWERDKEGVGGWLPMPEALRQAFDLAGVLGAGLVFPSPRKKRQPVPMSRFYARDLLERAEQLAELTPIDGGDWHPYRRLWATERKALPTADVALAAGWADRRTVEKYMQADPATLQAVMLFPQTAATPRTKTRTRDAHPKTKGVSKSA